MGPGLAGPRLRGARPRDIQNRASRGIGSDAAEARRFREFFGTTLRVVETLWSLLLREEIRPSGGRPWHLLWALYFLKVYPKEGPGCAVVGGGGGGIDPKTHRKWVWAFIEAISELVDEVVSVFDCRVFIYLINAILSRRRLVRLVEAAVVVVDDEDDAIVFVKLSSSTHPRPPISPPPSPPNAGGLREPPRRT